jgi:hypothetical protein
MDEGESREGRVTPALQLTKTPWLMPPKLGLERKPAKHAPTRSVNTSGVGSVAKESAKRLRKSPHTVHQWIHSEFDSLQERLATIVEVCYEEGNYNLAAKLLHPILSVHVEPHDDVDVANTVAGLIQDLHQLVELLTEWAFHRRNGEQVQKHTERLIPRALNVAAAVGHYDGEVARGQTQAMQNL